MTTDKKARRLKRKLFVRKVTPYIFMTAAIFGLVFYGSRNKNLNESSSLNLNSIIASNYNVTADQMSEFYTVSELANSMNLATYNDVRMNYNTIVTMREIGQVSMSSIEKPDIVDTYEIAGTGIIAYVVQEGETIESIAAQPRFAGVDATMIRWSNNLKATAAPAPGTTIYVPARAGFAYKVKNGDTIDSVAQKYKSSAEEIIVANSLELNPSIGEGMMILIPNGDLPDTERPDYVAPTPVAQIQVAPVRNVYWTPNNPGIYGQCTYYAWARRYQMGGNMVLPGGLGNAYSWYYQLAGSFYIDHSPRPGDVFQHGIQGYSPYGHVGIVESVNGDTITVSEMNYMMQWNRVTSRTVSSSTWGSWNFIHERR